MNVNTKLYCLCGAVLHILGNDIQALNILKAEWDKEHKGEGHGSCRTKDAKRARKKAARKLNAYRLSLMR